MRLKIGITISERQARGKFSCMKIWWMSSTIRPSLYFVFDVAGESRIVVSYVACMNGAFTHVNKDIRNVFRGCIYGSDVVDIKALQGIVQRCSKCL